MLESYNLAIGICHDKQVIYTACYYIDLSLLSAEFLSHTVQMIVICSLTISLQKCIKEPLDKPTAEQMAQRRESLQLLSKMAESENVSARKFMKCSELLKKAAMEPMKSMQRKYAGLGVLS